MSSFLDFTENIFSAGNRVLSGANNLSSTINKFSQSIGGFNQQSQGLISNFNDIELPEIRTNNTVRVADDQMTDLKKYGLIGGGLIALIVVLKMLKIF